VIGDPTKAGEMYMARTKFPPNYQIAAHTHPTAESVTLISGSVDLGEGDKLDTQKVTLLKAGAYVFNPAKHAHYAWTTNEEAVVQVQASDRLASTTSIQPTIPEKPNNRRRGRAGEPRGLRGG
jgi:quercetin dioxygenase-like cupin family protein